MDIVHLREWIGRTECGEDEVTRAPAAALAATLDREDPLPAAGEALPPPWHWLYFLPLHRQSELAEDGHAKRGGFLPPVPLPRRMWAGGRLEFFRPLRVGERIERTSRIADVSYKEGRSGPLVFVAVRHEIRDREGMVVAEQQDIVYRGHTSVSAAPPSAPSGHAWERTIEPGDVLLFRYSALTFNAHRIHYDRRYATGVEGYPGLVVHGPLIATLLLDLLRRNAADAVIRKFSFRAVSPLFDTAPFFVCGRPEGSTIRLWAKNDRGDLAMDAFAECA
ncbi:MAG: MaoC family dehydratase N-terminal domain-containing protein [Bryobacterales bacterium]|nr:MaoC family dehydratase N-terminal domain-containing protein [Bryobacterales bacterium]MBV9396968.1 MaoC family dehydratase N-terminal domain-containing protein [Bryobacterales bacterium]